MPDLDEDRAKREKRDFRVIDENPHNNSLWMIPVEPDVHGRREVKKVAAGPYNIGGFDWSPDSQRIAYETRPTPDADDARKSDILEADIETGDIRPDGRHLKLGKPAALFARRTIPRFRAQQSVREAD